MPPLEIARLALLVAQFVGLAALVGPYLLQVRSQSSPRMRPMLIGAIVQRRRGSEAASVRALFHAAGGFAIVTIIVAVVWT